ncbi:MAG: hypothetical protein HEP71_05725 [Roseivirga sp.]|nr:hypothetical protein [Roseivirga sp.]
MQKRIHHLFSFQTFLITGLLLMAVSHGLRAQAPVNNNQVDAIDINALMDNCSADAFYSNDQATSGGISGLYYDVWFKFTAPSSEATTIRVKAGGTQGTLVNGLIYARDQAGNWLGGASVIDGLMELSLENLIPEDTYYLVVGNSSQYGNVKGTFTVCLDSEPTFDHKAGATEISSLMDSCSANAYYSNDRATSGGISGLYYDVWFKFTAPSSEATTIRVKAGGAEGTLVNGLIYVQDQAGNWLGGTSVVDGLMELSLENLIPEDTYYLVVGNGSQYGNVKGTFTVCLDSEPTFDHKAGAIDINTLMDNCSANAYYSNDRATSGGISGLYYDVWFKFTAPSSEATTIRVKTGDAEGTLVNGLIYVQDQAGNGLGGVAVIDGLMELSLENLIAGDTYYLVVGNGSQYGNVKGTFTVCLENPTPVCSNELWSVASGDWSNPSVWSLTENGPPAYTTPCDQTIVYVKGDDISIDSALPVTVKRIEIVSSGIGMPSVLRVITGELNVVEKVFIQGSDSSLQSMVSSRVRVIGPGGG